MRTDLNYTTDTVIRDMAARVKTIERRMAVMYTGFVLYSVGMWGGLILNVVFR